MAGAAPRAVATAAVAAATAVAVEATAAAVVAAATAAATVRLWPLSFALCRPWEVEWGLCVAGARTIPSSSLVLDAPQCATLGRLPVAADSSRLLPRYTEHCRVRFGVAESRGPPPRPEGEFKLFVGGLAWATTDDGLYRAFDRFRPASCRVVMDREDRTRSRGFGFVSFNNREDADAAKSAMQGQDIDGRNINVDHASSR